MAASAARASAGDVAAFALPGGDGTAIAIGGVIAPGDEQSFHALAVTMGHAVVVLSGPGGRVAPALAIGQELRARGFRTLVPQDASCASACALIWLAGGTRALAPGARIGFHAIAAPVAGGGAAETHAFDPVLVQYLTDLGYSFDATATIVNTPSAMVRWLDALELNANGIATTSFP